jgi:hypothetical protein
MTACKTPIRPETVARDIATLDLVTGTEVRVVADASEPLFAPEAVLVAATGGPVLVRVGGQVEDGYEVFRQLRDGLEDDYEVTASEHSPSRAFYVARLCEGHESLRGDAFGAALYCDGTVL